MTTLDIIGSTVIALGMFRYLIYPKLQEKKAENERLVHKIKVLSRRHPEVSKIFDRKQKKHSASVFYDDDDDFSDDGVHIEVFGRIIYVHTDAERDEFISMVVAKIKELEKSPAEQQKIDAILKEHADRTKREFREKEIKYLEWRKNLLEYDEVVKEIFPHTGVYLDKESVTEQLSIRLHLSASEASSLFEKLSHRTTGIILTNFGSNNTIQYWYSESHISDKTIDSFHL